MIPINNAASFFKVANLLLQNKDIIISGYKMLSGFWTKGSKIEPIVVDGSDNLQSTSESNSQQPESSPVDEVVVNVFASIKNILTCLSDDVSQDKEKSTNKTKDGLDLLTDTVIVLLNEFAKAKKN